jgi:capsular polysaccharide biosynthesis protein
MFVPYVTPILARVRRRVRGDAAELPLAATARLIAPRQSTWSAPALMLEDEWRRVLGVMDDTTLAKERIRLMGGAREHGATRLFRVGPASLRGGTVYAGRGYLPLNPGGRPRDVRRDPVPMARALLCTNAAAQLYFSHWLLESLSTELLAEEVGLQPLSAIPHVGRPHEAEYRARLGLPDPTQLAADIDELWIADDPHLNAHRRGRLAELRRRLRVGLGIDAGDESAHGPAVFLLREGSGAQRLLRNEADLATRLESQGVRTLAPHRDSLEDLMAACACAPMVIGIEGSSLAHAALVMPRGAHLVVIQPPRRFNNFFKDYADALGLSYATTVADPEADPYFRLEWDRLARLLELLPPRG